MSVVLYCKSYRNDVLRACRLAQSIARFNVERLPFYVSVPTSDLPLFRERLRGFDVNLLADEDIVRANPALAQSKIDALPGRLSQQIVKSEFWRLKVSETYVCLDSDCQFIRDFRASDFIAPQGYPYTVMHESKELLQFVVNHGMEKIYDSFHKEHAQLQEIIGRPGRPFDFGPCPPLIWSASVWGALDRNFLAPRGMSFHDAILLFPAEIQWYGEAMLKYHPFPLLPVEPLFKVYHYEAQHELGLKQGDSLDRIAKNFMGVIYQSNWEKASDFEARPKPLPSRLWRAFRRRVLGRRH